MSTCAEVLDDLAALVAGDPDAIARHADHLASCDACRDARHDATELAARVGQAGRDHVPPADLVARVLAAAPADPVATDPAAAAPSAAAPEPAMTGAADDPTPAPPAAGVAATPAPVAAAAAATPARAAPPAADKPARPRPDRRPPHRWLGLGLAAAIAAGGVGVLALARQGDEAAPRADRPQVPRGAIGALATLARAAADGAHGVSIRVGADWQPLAKGAALPAGAALRTDERTRALLELGDGTKLVLDHQTELAFDAREPRRVTLTAGRISADVAHVDGRPAAFTTPSGTVDVLGTKLVLTATPTLTSVQVVRGSVALTGASGAREQVHAGEEGVVERGALSVGAAPSLARELGWTELEQAPGADATAASGLGALRAYKPGERRDRDWNLALASHDVKVRIVGPIARTEITETFRNDSDQTLEGVYQFPLPADAQIDGLALDVASEPGGFMTGAFLDKKRAQKIWQGVIDKATPQQIARSSEEIIWVPGPWRDPALLDWQRGGRFELKIFPIPPKGSRTIKIAYTQVVTARGAFRQYVYPLAHSSDGSTVADRLTVDVEVRGAAPDMVRARGYQLVPDPGRRDVNALTMTAAGFVPRGDLVIDYRAADGDAELRAWTFAGNVAVAPDAKLAAKRGVEIDPQVVAAQRAVAADARPTAVLALRPALPRWHESKPRDVMIVVDVSQSMVGERFARARALTAAIVEQMDRRDRFSVMACDSACRGLGDLRAPSAPGATEVLRWLDEQAPAGASDVVAAVRSAAEELGGDGAGQREGWVLYIGDGFATTGFRRAGDVERALAEVGARGVHVTTIGIGGDADRTLLAAAARGGGGSYLAWTPGQSVRTAALAALESTQGAALRAATVELPAGLTDVAPTVLPTVRAGEEVLIAARLTGAVAGDVVVRGEVGGQPFEQRYPLKLAVSSAAGNGFVPRLWASLAIDQLERRGEGDDRNQIVALSQGYGVMSRETSLLVLESAAMFDAFGVDRTTPTTTWTGEDALDEVVATGELQAAAPVGTAGYGYGEGAGAGAGAGGKAAMPARASRAPSATPTAMAAPEPEPAAAEDKAERAPSKKRKDSPADAVIAADPVPPPPPPDLTFDRMSGRPMIAMRRTWVRVPSVAAYGGVSAPIERAIASAEAALAASPDSREKHRALVQALAYAGELDRARDVAARWLERDRLDPQALGYQADLLGRGGQRELALRTLAGLVDLAADRPELHERMVRAYDTAGQRAQACAHRIALAALSPRSPAIAGATMRCLRAIGRDADAQLVARALPDDAARAAAEKAALVAAPEPRLAGDLVVHARWDGPADLDLSLVTPAGARVSWMGGRTDAVVRDARSTEQEQLAIKRLRRGNYLLEIARTDRGHGPIRGALEISVLGTRQTLPFELLGERAVVGRLAVTLEQRLEPVDGGPTRRPPRIAIGPSSDERVARVVRARQPVLMACYQRELARQPALQGRLQAVLAIAADGRVTEAEAAGAMPSGLRACVRANLQRLRFPAGTASPATFPLTFQPPF